jgi:hypothetical protein
MKESITHVTFMKNTEVTQDVALFEVYKLFSTHKPFVSFYLPFFSSYFSSFVFHFPTPKSPVDLTVTH